MPFESNLYECVLVCVLTYVLEQHAFNFKVTSSVWLSEEKVTAELAFDNSSAQGQGKQVQVEAERIIKAKLALYTTCEKQQYYFY